MIGSNLQPIPSLFEGNHAILSPLQCWQYEMLFYRALHRERFPFQITQQVCYTYDPMKGQDTKIEAQSPTHQTIKLEAQDSDDINIGLTGKQTQDLTNKRGAKKAKKVIFEQKEGRNCNSNLLRMFLRRVQTTVEANSSFIDSIIIGHNIQTSSETFARWFHKLNIDTNRYIRLPVMKRLFTNTQQFKQEALVLRILLKKFIYCEAHTSFLTSKKAKRGTMKHNLDSIRGLLGSLFRGARPRHK